MFGVLRNIAVDFWQTVAEMSPYLLFGFFVAGLLSVLVSQRVVQRHLGGRGLLPLFKASIFGVPLPLCSCGVIPVSMSLHKHGAGRGATIAFLLSTPQTGADSILVTYSLLGPVFAVFRPLAALATGLVGGVAVNLFGRQPRPRERTEECKDRCCAAVGPKEKILAGLRYGFVTLPRDIGKAMFVGLLIAAVISAVVPEGFFSEKLGTRILAMLCMMAMGIPVYVCATASVPVAASLILKGLTPGAALVFLMTGPATNAAGLATIWKTLGPRVALLYLGTVAGSALAAGLLLDALALHIDIGAMAHHHSMMPPILQYASAILLLALLLHATLRPKRHH